MTDARGPWLGFSPNPQVCDLSGQRLRKEGTLRYHFCNWGRTRLWVLRALPSFPTLGNSLPISTTFPRVTRRGRATVADTPSTGHLP